MSLGVLNNLSAMSAANNLNNTNNSLSKTLQQLSSGSKINGGSDDAAGLSLVNGLQANSTALAQSQTNAQEGVGLLQVADGALSQVTNLLNRAVTLATEVSNGTLNGSQQTAANQEYQSILSEINNIGSTTTYNQNQVFGSVDRAIYTGDSSTASASQDSLHFATLSSSSVGDANGKMVYSQGQGTFIDLQAGAAGGTVGAGDTVNGNITLTVWDPLANAGAGGTATKVIAGGGGTLAALVDKINSGGYGVTASLQTKAQAIPGTIGATSGDLGIEIRGNVSAATVPTGSVAQGAGFTQVTNTSLLDATITTGVANASAASGTGTAQISYQAGINNSANLTNYDLTSQSNAQSTLTVLNTAISDVAAQQGYIGAQINTLNAVSSVMNTQQQNIVAAQNAVQATDYATAASNMSKYQILSQTGISALAQANSVQQEVLKLLQ